MLIHAKPNGDNIAGFYEPNKNLVAGIATKNSDAEYQYFENIIDPLTVSELKDLFYNANVSEDVSIHGMKDLSIGIGSKRTTMWSEELANSFTKEFGSLFSKRKNVHHWSRTDFWQQLKAGENTYVWEFVGFSPMFRFMKYVDGGEHYAHYDAAYIYDDPTYRTLSSVVIYLTTNNTGETRFIIDNQDHIKQKDRINDDWTRRTELNEVYKSFKPVEGSMLVFDHRVCHDVSQFIPEKEGEERIIIRTDLIYKLVK
jgi:hypothetical protein